MTDPDRLKQLRDEAITALQDITDQSINEMCRRGAEPAGRDGYAGGDGGGRNQHGTSRPTESVGIALAELGTPSDPVGDHIEAWSAALMDCRNAARSASNRQSLVFAIRQLSPEDVQARKAGVGDCQCCGVHCAGSATVTKPGEKAERLKSGYCEACSKAYRRAGSPDRAVFERERRAYLQAKSA